MTPIQVKSPYLWGDILSLVQTSFTYMDTRINPPSSMHNLTADMIAQHADKNEIWVIEDANTPIACVFLTPKKDRLYSHD